MDRGLLYLRQVHGSILVDTGWYVNGTLRLQNTPTYFLSRTTNNFWILWDQILRTSRLADSFKFDHFNIIQYLSYLYLPNIYHIYTPYFVLQCYMLYSWSPVQQMGCVTTQKR